jgi:hypothetical protein
MDRRLRGDSQVQYMGNYCLLEVFYTLDFHVEFFYLSQRNTALKIKK